MDSTFPLLGFADPLSSWLHLAGALLAALSARALWRVGATRGEQLALATFAAGATIALAVSGAYHATSDGEARAVMQRLDHAGIWILIAATFTPVHAIAFRGFARWGFLAFIWVGALAGVVLKTIYFDALPEGLGLALYLGFGWVGVASGVMLARQRGWRAVAPMMVGGLLYTAGGAASVIGMPALVPGFLGHHELFHAAVLAALLAHWRFIEGLGGRACAGGGRVLDERRERFWHSASCSPRTTGTEEPTFR